MTRSELALALLAALLVSRSARTAESAIVDDTREAACTVLKDRIGKGLPNKKPDPHWFCDFTNTNNEFIYIVALRSNAPRDDGATVYSNLVGWFAVARRSDLVLGFDVGEQRLEPLPQEYLPKIMHGRISCASSGRRS